MIPISAYGSLIDRSLTLTDVEKRLMWQQLLEIRLLPRASACPAIEKDRWS